MAPLGLHLSQPVGFVDLDHVWLDDRMRCRWGLEDFSLVATPGQTVVVLDDESEGRVAHDVLDLVAGSRRPIRGRVSIDGVSLADLSEASRAAAVAELSELGIGGERRVLVAGRTSLVADPRPLTLVAANQVVVVAHGTVVAAGSHRQLMLAGGRYAKRFGEVTAA